MMQQNDLSDFKRFNGAYKWREIRDILKDVHGVPHIGDIHHIFPQSHPDAFEGADPFQGLDIHNIINLMPLNAQLNRELSDNTHGGGMLQTMVVARNIDLLQKRLPMALFQHAPHRMEWQDFERLFSIEKTGIPPIVLEAHREEIASLMEVADLKHNLSKIYDRLTANRPESFKGLIPVGDSVVLAILKDLESQFTAARKTSIECPPLELDLGFLDVAPISKLRRQSEELASIFEGVVGTALVVNADHPKGQEATANYVKKYLKGLDQFIKDYARYIGESIESITEDDLKQMAQDLGEDSHQTWRLLLKQIEQELEERSTIKGLRAVAKRNEDIERWNADQRLDRHATFAGPQRRSIG